MTEKTAKEFQRIVELANRNRMWIKLEEAKIYYEMQSDGGVRYCLRIVRMLNGRWCECLPRLRNGTASDKRLVLHTTEMLR